MQLPPMLQGAKARELAAFVESVTQEGATVLPDAAQKAAAFHTVAHSLVYDVLMSKVSSCRICPICHVLQSLAEAVFKVLLGGRANWQAGFRGAVQRLLC